MRVATLFSSNALFRATLKALVFGLSAFAGIFFASASYGLLEMLLFSTSGDADIGIAEFSTHGGLTIGKLSGSANNRLQRTAERHHVRAASASFHFAHAACWTRHNAAEPDR
jgi:hypothetical protein